MLVPELVWVMPVPPLMTPVELSERTPVPLTVMAPPPERVPVRFSVPAVTLVAGVNLYGGYDAANRWSRGKTNSTLISGSPAAVAANGGTVRFSE